MPPGPGGPPARPAALRFGHLVALRAGRSCVRPGQRLRVRLRRPVPAAVSSLTVRVGSARAVRRTGRRLGTPVTVRARRRGRTVVRVAVRLEDGRLLRATRRYRACRAER